MASKPLHARQTLRDKLRELRGSTPGAAFARQLGWGENGQPKVSKIERGKQLPSEQDVRGWAAATGGDSVELLALLAEAGAEFTVVKDLYSTAGGAEGHQAFIGLKESSSARLTIYEPNMVIALLQTADYARAVMSVAGIMELPPDELARAIAARLRRSAILYEPGRQLTLLLGEAALRVQVTDLDVHLRQLEHLAQLAADLPGSVTFGIFPLSVRHPFVSASGYTMYDDLITIETLGGDLEVLTANEVSWYHTLTSFLLGAAVTGEDAATLIRAVANQIREQAENPFWWRSGEA